MNQVLLFQYLTVGGGTRTRPTRASTQTALASIWNVISSDHINCPITVCPFSQIMYILHS